MASIDVTDHQLSIHFSAFEKVAGLIGDQVVPLAAIDEVTVEAAPLAAVKGIRAPGMALPGRTKIGTWRTHGHRHLVRVRRDQPAVSIATHGGRYDRYVIGDDDARATADRIERALARR